MEPEPISFITPPNWKIKEITNEFAFQSEEQREICQVEQPPECGIVDIARAWVSTWTTNVSVAVGALHPGPPKPSPLCQIATMKSNGKSAEARWSFLSSKLGRRLYSSLTPLESAIVEWHRGADVANRWCWSLEAADEREAHHSMERPPECSIYDTAKAWVSIGVDKLGKSNGEICQARKHQSYYDAAFGVPHRSLQISTELLHRYFRQNFLRRSRRSQITATVALYRNLLSLPTLCFLEVRWKSFAEAPKIRSCYVTAFASVGSPEAPELLQNGNYGVLNIRWRTFLESWEEC
nr:hypothetical protein Iba_chr03bCG5670 [Ipomoea batatas]